MHFAHFVLDIFPPVAFDARAYLKTKVAAEEKSRWALMGQPQEAKPPLCSLRMTMNF